MLEKIFPAANQNSPGWEGIIYRITTPEKNLHLCSPGLAACLTPQTSTSFPVLSQQQCHCSRGGSHVGDPFPPFKLSPSAGSLPHLLECCHRQGKETQGPSPGAGRGRTSGRCLLLRVEKSSGFQLVSLYMQLNSKLLHHLVETQGFKRIPCAKLGWKPKTSKVFMTQ